MDVIYDRVAGLDVHKETVVATVRVMVGRKAERECRTFETTTAGLSALLAWLTETRCSHVAMEATGVYWKPVWNILSDGAFELIVANAAHIKNVPGRKTDVNDATSPGSPQELPRFPHPQKSFDFTGVSAASASRAVAARRKLSARSPHRC